MEIKLKKGVPLENSYTNIYPYQLSCKMNRVNVIWLRTDKMRFYMRHTLRLLFDNFHSKTFKQAGRHRGGWRTMKFKIWLMLNVMAFEIFHVLVIKWNLLQQFSFFAVHTQSSNYQTHLNAQVPSHLMDGWRTTSINHPFK